MLRHYYISDDLDDLEVIEEELRNQGFTTSQFHVLSEQDAEVEKRHLHAIEPVLKKDVVHSMQLGAVTGFAAASILLMLAWSLNWHEFTAGWALWIFLAVVVLGFCTWEGGLVGIQLPHYQFKRFQNTLRDGKHIFFIDVDAAQEASLSAIVEKHSKLSLAGTDEAAPAWVVKGQDRIIRMLHHA